VRQEDVDRSSIGVTGALKPRQRGKEVVAERGERCEKNVDNRAIPEARQRLPE